MKQFILLIFATCIILPSFADTTYVYQLPFEEKFTTGVFTTNEWTVEGVNWQVNGQEGNPLPSAMFAYTPADTNYSKSLISPPVNGTGFISGKIFLNYDILLDDGIASGQEKLSAEVFDGSQWVTVYSDSSVGDFNWKRNHVDITEAAKGDTFQVRFRAYGLNSININKWLIDNINIYRSCEAPKNLNVSIPDPVNHGDQYLLEWEGPDVPNYIFEWIQWDDGVNYSGIGVGAAATWAAAVRFTPTQLVHYAGTRLTKIRFFASGAAGTSFVLKVWTGANASTLVVSQPVSSFVNGTWNEYSLNTPVPISGTTELWFGYELTQPAADFPAGSDNGPAIDGFGNMVNLDGVWETLYSLNAELNYNWNIQGWIESESKTMDSLDIQGYNIYLEQEWIAFTTDTWYIDTISYRNTYCYNVTTVYQDCESVWSNTDCFTVSTNDLGLNKLNIFPNPASNKVEFELDDEIRQFVIYNLLGEVISEVNVNSSKQTISSDLTNYQNGIYLVKFIASKGESTTRKLIVAK